MARQVFIFEKRKGIHSKNNKPTKKYRGQGR